MCGSPVKINCLQFLLYNGTLLYGHLLYTDSFICPDKKLINNNNILFPLKLIFFIQTPVNTDNGHFSVSRVTNSHTYCQPHFTDTGYLHTVYFHCHNYVVIVDIVPCSNNDRFSRWIKFYYSTKKKNSKNKVVWHIWFWTVSLSSGVWLLYYVLPFNKVFCLLLHVFHFLGFLLQPLLLK